jgi:hypothetical protein
MNKNLARVVLRRSLEKGVLTSAVLLMVTTSVGCGWISNGPARTLDFHAFDRANRIQVIDMLQEKTVITDKHKVDAARRFIQARNEGWRGHWRGNRAPWLHLDFFEGDKPLGGFGVAGDYITNGGYYQHTPPRDTAELARMLELEWPPKEY